MLKRGGGLGSIGPQYDTAEDTILVYCISTMFFAAVHIFFLVDVFILLGENATRLFLYATTWDLFGAFFFGLADIIYIEVSVDRCWWHLTDFFTTFSQRHHHSPPVKDS